VEVIGFVHYFTCSFFHFFTASPTTQKELLND